MKQFLAITICAFLTLIVSAQDTQIRKGGGGAGGSATNAVATIRKDGTPIVNGATVIDFTNAAGTVVTVTADGTTARVGIPQATAYTDTITNASTRDFGVANRQIYSENLSANHRWVYFDDFNQPMTTPGLFPDAPTGHKYTVLSTYANTNQINVEDGRWWMGATNGAIYLSVDFKTNGLYGSQKIVNQWGGTFSYHSSTNSTVDGVERNLTFILSTNADFIARPFLHISIGVSYFRVQRELSSTNIIYAVPHEGGRYLAFNTNHQFTVTILGNNIICDIAGMRYIGYEPLLTTVYKDLTVATWESTGSPTNQFWGKWDNQFAGYASNPDYWLFAGKASSPAGPFTFGSNGILTDIEFSGTISNSTTGAGGFRTLSTTGFRSESSPTDFLLLSQPQGGIYGTLDGWVLGQGLSGATIMGLSTNTSTIESNLWIKGTNFARQIKMVGGQAASSILRLDSNTNLATVTVGANLSFDGTTLSATGGGGGGTNFPNVNLLVGNTNLVLSAGVRKAFHNQTNGSHGINLNLAAPESGYEVTYSVSNSASSDITVTFYTNSVAANPYDIATKTNVNTFTASASSITDVRLKFIGNGIWVLERVFGPTSVLKFGSGAYTDTNGANNLDITLSTITLTNYANAATNDIDCSRPIQAAFTNDLSGNQLIRLLTPRIGTWGNVYMRDSGSARTIGVAVPTGVGHELMSTNWTSNSTNILTVASKLAVFSYEVTRGTNGTTNISWFVTSKTP